MPISNTSPVKIFTGFLVLFLLYHFAEYMIVFKNSPAGFLGFQLLFFVAAWGIARWQGFKGFAAWGLDGRKNWLLHLLVGMLMGLALYGLAFLIALKTDAEKITAIPDFSSISSSLALFVFGNFFSSLSEDILTRGYVFRHLKGKVSLLVIVFASAFIYTLNHIYKLDKGFELLFYLFSLGLVYIVPVVVSGRLWFTGGMHWAGNCLFFYTHEIIKTDNGNGSVSFNYLLAFLSLLFIPLVYFLHRKCFANSDQE